jgi:hypothetical protein
MTIRLSVLTADHAPHVLCALRGSASAAWLSILVSATYHHTERERENLSLSQEATYPIANHIGGRLLASS